MYTLYTSKIQYLSSLSDTIYPDKNSGPFPASSHAISAKDVGCRSNFDPSRPLYTQDTSFSVKSSLTAVCQGVQTLSTDIFDLSTTSNCSTLPPGSPARTTCHTPHCRREKQLLYSLVDTTTDHRREHGGSKRELAYGADTGRWAFIYATTCMSWK